MIVHTCAQSYFAPAIEISGFSTKLTYVLLRTSPPSPFSRLRRACRSRSEVRRFHRNRPTACGHAGAHTCMPSGFGLRRMFPPKQASSVHFVTLPRWRPSARLTTRRYVKDQIPQFPTERRNYTKSPSRLARANGEFSPVEFFLVYIISFRISLRLCGPA